MSRRENFVRALSEALELEGVDPITGEIGEASVIIARNWVRTAMDPSQPHYMGALKSLQDHVLGKPQENVAIDVTGHTTLAMSPAGLSIFGFNSGKVIERSVDGDVKEVEIKALNPFNG